MLGYVAITYSGGKAKLYVDTNNTPTEFTGSLPAEIPNTRADFFLGEKFKGYLDETFVSSLEVGTLGRNLSLLILIFGIIQKHLLIGNMMILHSSEKILILGLFV